MEHPDDATLLHYVTEQASEDKLLEVDRHLLECEECLWRVRGLRYLRENFDSILESWTPQEHARLYRQWRIAEALAKVEAPSDREARRWSELLAKGLLMTVRCTIDRVRKIAESIAQDMPPGYQLAAESSPVGVGVPPPDGQETVALDSHDTQSVTRNIVRDGKIIGELIVDGVKQRILVKYWPDEVNDAPEFVLLLPEQESVEPRRAKFEPIEGTNYVLAEFLELDDGNYTVVLGPAEARSTGE